MTLSEQYDNRRVYDYCTMMMEIISNLITCSLMDTEKMRFTRYPSGRVYYKNKIRNAENKLFNFGTVLEGSYPEYRSQVSMSKDPDNHYFKIEYFDNNVTTLPVQVEVDGIYQDIQMYTPEELVNDAYMFQQSLVLDEPMLFGLLCLSILRFIGVRNMHIICEFTVQDMTAVYEDYLNAKRKCVNIQ
ncbi:hypothetical protein SEPL_361 [Salmonella phage SE_PL]|nr:hypothetical protein [Salmonella enterica]QCW18736.1 hypothetical protein 7t3_0215 [Salmonella phage 7t3]QIG62974.1 hypothetical protein SEPL_361 [Salmonella phage SE_PL]WNV47168.1 hypothetical protein [Klebsiella phage fENko-Kae01]